MPLYDPLAAVEATTTPNTAGLVLTSTGAGVAAWQVKTTDWLNVKSYGAVGDGVTDDTAAVTAWINAINAAAPGVSGYLPAGQYIVKSLLPSVTANGITLAGDGWAQTAGTAGSVISAGDSAASPVLTVAGEGITVTGLTVDGEGRAPTVVAVTGSHAVLADMQARGVGSGGVCIDIQTGGLSAWLNNCVINALNGSNTGIQVNDTDMIMTGCKPQSSAWCVVLLSGASGAIIANNHMTPGAAVGQNCIYINGNPSHVLIANNRFDNYVRSAIQITPPSSTPNNIQISGNQFHSTVMTDNTYALIALDTTASGVRGLHIVNNAGYATGTHRPAYGFAAQTQAGADATSPTRISSLGTVFLGNNFWAAGGMYGPSATPLVYSGNMISTNGTAYAAAETIIDSTASDIAALGTRAAGAVGLAADAGHVHPVTGLMTSSVFRVVTSAITPSATVSTFGTATTVNPDAGFAGLWPTAVSYAASGLATETVTVQCVVTWSDNSTTTSSTTTTTNSTTNISASQMAALMAGGDTRYAKSLAWSVKSSISSSAASVAVTILGLNQS